MSKDLVLRCLQNDPRAQRQLYDTYSKQMLGVCFRYVKSYDDANDILQDGFVRVFKFLGQYNYEGELGAWIRSIMVRTALNFLKKNKKYRSEMIFDESPLHTIETEAVEIKLNQKDLLNIIRQLPIGYQTVFNLHAIEGYSHVEIAELLGITDSTSRSQYQRARKILVEKIKNTNDKILKIETKLKIANL